MFQTWFKIFFRNQKKNWLNGVVNVSGLTLSLTVLILVLLYLNEERKYNQENSGRNEIYRVVHAMSDGDIWGVSTSVEGPTYKNEIPEVIETYLNEGEYKPNLVYVEGKKHYTVKIIKGEASFFDFFPFEIVKGSIDKFKETSDNVAISDTLAKRYFGSVSAIGKTIEFNNRVFIITTVFKIKGKHYFEPDLVIQYKDYPKEEGWGSYSYDLLVKTTKGNQTKSLENKMNELWYKNSTVPSAEKEGMTPVEWDKKHGTKVLLESLKDIRLEGYTRSAGPEGKGNYKLIKILLSLAVLLVIISCVNFINLSVSSAEQRAKEVGVKKTLGISKKTLFVQYTTEILLLGLISFIFSLILVELILPHYNLFLKKDIILMEEKGIIFKTFLVNTLLSLIIGFIIAFKLVHFKPSEVLKGNITRSKKGLIIRNIMLGLQFVISGFFLIASLVVYKQVNYMMEKDLGFSGDNILLVKLSQGQDNYQNYLIAKEELVKQNSNIIEVTSNFFVPNGNNDSSTNAVYKENDIQTNINPIDFNYFDILKIDILKGRKLQERFASDTITNILINEKMAKGLGIYNDPIDKKIHIPYPYIKGDRMFNVVGMVKDYHIYGLDREIPSIAFFHWSALKIMRDHSFYNFQIKIKNENIEETIDFIRKYWKLNIEQEYPFDYQFLDKSYQKTFKNHQKQKTLLTILTLTVIIISLLGLFALATLTIQQRLKEIAIRKALGASTKEIMFQLIKIFLKITIYATLILVPFSFYVIQEKWLNDFVYRIEMPLYPYIITPIVLTILICVVVGIKAYLATKINLIKYLKFE